MGNELLTWYITVSRAKIISKRNWLLSAVLFVFSLVITSFSLSIFVIAIIFLIYVFVSKTSFKYSMDEKGISKIDGYEPGKTSLTEKFVIGYEKTRAGLVANKIGSNFYMPYEAVKYYSLTDEIIELIPKIPRGLSFVILPKNNATEIISILNKQNVKERKNE